MSKNLKLIKFDIKFSPYQSGKDIVGRTIEDWVGEWMKTEDITYSEREISQLPPDYYLGEDKDKCLKLRLLTQKEASRLI